MNKFNEKAEQIAIVKLFSDKYGIKSAFIVLLACSPLVVYIFWGLAWAFIVDFIGIVFPAYMSLRAVETDSKSDDTQWLTYWVVYSMIHILDEFKDIIFFWVPFYDFIMLGFIVWMVLPQTRGAFAVYHYVLRPLLMRYEKNIDRAYERAVAQTKECGGSVGGVAYSAAVATGAKAMSE